MVKHIDDWEEEYAEWLEGTCKCDHEEEGCASKDFDEWYQDILFEIAYDKFECGEVA